jgi:photosystem II stability/assembly factor-like uncharacterized protein
MFASTSTPRTPWLALCLLVGLVAATGCTEALDGSGDDDSNTTETNTTTTNPDDGDGGGDDGDDSTEGSSGGWQKISPPAQRVHINSVHFHDDQRGWLTTTGFDKMVDERGAWYTDDGGQTWDLRREQFDAYVAKFDANGERVWMGGSDSRELWYADDNDDFKPYDDGIQQQDWIGDLYFWDKQTGILGSQTAGRIHRTTNGGETFEIQEFGQKDAGFNDFEVLGDEVWASTGVDFQDDGTGARIHYSDDRGATWELHKLEDQAHHYKGGSIQAVHAVSSDEVWAAGVNRQLYHTTDGMETWEQIEGVPADAYGFNDIDGAGDTLIAGGNHDDGIFIYESHDGGESWEMTFVGDTCGSSCEIEGIEVVNEDLAYAYGYGETLIRFNGR